MVAQFAVAHQFQVQTFKEAESSVLEFTVSRGLLANKVRVSVS